MPGEPWAKISAATNMTTEMTKNVESGVFSGQESIVNVNSDAENEDIYGLLEQKERDLLLAAELGKALLEKNEELSQQNEKMAEDFSQKLEVRHIIFFLNVALLQCVAKSTDG